MSSVFTVNRENSVKNDENHNQDKFRAISNDQQGESPDDDEFTFYMNFAYFLKMAIPMMSIHLKNQKIIDRVNSLNFENNLEYDLSGLKIRSLSGEQPIYKLQIM